MLAGHAIVVNRLVFTIYFGYSARQYFDAIPEPTIFTIGSFDTRFSIFRCYTSIYFDSTIVYILIRYSSIRYHDIRSDDTSILRYYCTYFSTTNTILDYLTLWYFDISTRFSMLWSDIRYFHTIFDISIWYSCFRLDFRYDIRFFDKFLNISIFRPFDMKVVFSARFSTFRSDILGAKFDTFNTVLSALQSGGIMAWCHYHGFSLRSNVLMTKRYVHLY